MREIDVEKLQDPIALIVGARNALDSIRSFLLDVEDRREGITAMMSDPRRRAMVLDHIAFVGEYLARLTVVIDKLEDDGISALKDEIRLELLIDAWEVAARRSEIPSREGAPSKR